MKWLDALIAPAYAISGSKLPTRGVDGSRESGPMDRDRPPTIEKPRCVDPQRQRGQPPGLQGTQGRLHSLASTTSAQACNPTTNSDGSRGRELEPGDVSIGAQTRTITDSLQLGVEAALSRIRRLTGLDLRYARPLRHYLRQAIQDCIEHAELQPSAGVDPDGLRRYRWACRRLLPSDRELIVAKVELGYSYDQLALATDRSSAPAARSAVRRALLRLVKEMGCA